MTGACSCRDEEPTVIVRTIPGTIVRIDTGSRRVTLQYVHEKSAERREVEGEVSPDTEIFINGKLSSLADIKVGEHAVVQGRIVKFGDRKQISALRIDITRDQTVTFDSGRDSAG